LDFGIPLLPRFAEQEDAYSAKPMAWKLERKRIHNYRCIIFDPAYLPRRLNLRTYQVLPRSVSPSII
jgi:hypothetical protein